TVGRSPRRQHCRWSSTRSTARPTALAPGRGNGSLSAESLGWSGDMGLAIATPRGRDGPTVSAPCPVVNHVPIATSAQIGALELPVGCGGVPEPDSHVSLPVGKSLKKACPIKDLGLATAWQVTRPLTSSRPRAKPAAAQACPRRTAKLRLHVGQETAALLHAGRRFLPFADARSQLGDGLA